MNLFVKLIKAKWIFKKPNRKDILIYDSHSVGYSQFLFPKKKCEILNVRYESINLYVLLATFLAFGIKNFKDNYKKKFIELVSPKIVYTAISGNLAFYKLKNIYNKPTYICDQHGMSKVGNSYKESEFYEEAKKYMRENKKQLRADHMFFFGKNYAAKDSKIIKGNFHIFGNTKNNHFKIKAKKVKKKINSIMFIASGRIGMGNTFKRDQIIFANLTKFCEKKNIKLFFASRLGVSDEIFCRNNFAKGNWIYLPRTSIQKTYQNLNKQKMVVLSHSSLGFEALSKGLKCAFFSPNFPEKGHHGKYPKSGLFWTNSLIYYDFEKLVNRVMRFSNNKWKKIVNKYSAEILTYDPSNIKKKKLIRSVLKNSVQ
mgnify:CR=1 FL=1|tara:strand:- start:636 stop:1745 length:1110 start_codon:yes stop_codon:yes gene_type:complete